MSKPFIGIKAIYYGEPITEAVTSEKLTTWLGTAETVENVHQDTWSYEQGDPDIEDYLNELDGKIYYRDAKTAGSKTISFTIGKYDAQTKANLCSGTVNTEEEMWAAPDGIPLVNKAIVAVTKSGNTIVFTNASIVAKAAPASKNIGLGVTAVAMDNDKPDVADEYIFWKEILKPKQA